MEKSILSKIGSTVRSVLPGLFVALIIVRPFTLYCSVRYFRFRKSKRKMLRKEFAWVSKILLWSLGVQVISLTRKILNSGNPYIVNANHSSFVDVLLVGLYFDGAPGVAVVDKKMFWWLWLFGMRFWLVRTSTIGFNRKDPEDEKRVTEEMKKVLREGKLHLFIFPEGTRTTTGQLLEFEDGPFILARRYQRDIVPVSIIGAFAFSNKKSKSLNPGSVYIVNNTIVSSKGKSTRELSDAVKNAIQYEIDMHKHLYSSNK